MPASFVILDRVVWGMSALLGKLDATGPWKRHARSSTARTRRPHAARRARSALGALVLVVPALRDQVAPGSFCLRVAVHHCQARGGVIADHEVGELVDEQVVEHPPGKPTTRGRCGSFPRPSCTSPTSSPSRTIAPTSLRGGGNDERACALGRRDRSSRWRACARGTRSRNPALFLSHRHRHGNRDAQQTPDRTSGDRTVAANAAHHLDVNGHVADLDHPYARRVRREARQRKDVTHCQAPSPRPRRGRSARHGRRRRARSRRRP